MRSNATTLRIVGGVFAACGIVTTIIGAIIGFIAYIIPGIIILICGIFITSVNTCIYFGLANIQNNQLILAEMIESLHDDEQEESIDEIEDEIVK